MILIINGPNLNLLGKREPDIYGSETFEDILAELKDRYPQFDLHYFQSNHEGAIIDRLQDYLTEKWDGLIVNMGAFTHYSYAIHDALLLVDCPKVEVHISHVYRREAFRHTSVTAKACDAMLTGFGKHGYDMALRYMQLKIEGSDQ